jgi:hypothetical protein
LIVLTLPPEPAVLTPVPDGAIRGVLHIHTTRSDGQGTPEQVAAAAARVGLRFIVFTDHGDATRIPDPPTYRSGVLCLDAVEISTSGGHYVALGMPAAPYPLGGEPRDVVEDVGRLGGFGIAAHPDSPKPELSWRDWAAKFDGIELLNLDTSWRILANASSWAPKWRLLTGIVDYPFRPAPVIADLIQPTRVLDRWIALTGQRRVVVMAAADAHGRLTIRGGDPASTKLAVPVPGYENTFRVMSVHVLVGHPLTGRAPDDAAAILRAIRMGHLYAAVDAVAEPTSFDFTATNALGTVHEGDELGVGGPVLLHVTSNAPNQFTTIVHERDRVISAVQDTQDLTVHGPDGPGVFWVEIVSTGRRHPTTWIRSNPIYVRTAAPLVQALARPPERLSTRILNASGASWRTEHDPTSTCAFDSALNPGGNDFDVQFRYGLSSGLASGQYAALVYDTPNGLAAYDRLTFDARGDRPMRVSVQIRALTNDGPIRWQRSVYLDTFDHQHAVVFSDMKPVGTVEVRPPALERVRSVLFVVDTTNTKPGSSGRVWMRNLSFEG